MSVYLKDIQASAVPRHRIATRIISLTHRRRELATHIPIRPLQDLADVLAPFEERVVEGSRQLDVPILGRDHLDDVETVADLQGLDRTGPKLRVG